MLFHNDSASIIASIEAGESFKTTSYWRHTLISQGIVSSPEWNYRYSGRYIIVTRKGA